ncbi:hypothetical protein JVT61DRAFT_11199 [Boletus reticuloceps]|uniref:Uncharacterized protein n=1 Tax=Boletus reticuloceps TaxID=495285 RepID=A0A8I2YCC9_9AGAM|nr:hypothetical protein JVT61DRAFT_15557 [Boletus reticuloceps]KAG6370679.1 hypothetical protein JVT61DRAFT_11199 [Boletus reticuloceps]
MSPEERLRLTEELVAMTIVKLVPNGSAAQWKLAVQVIDSAMDDVRAAIGEAAQIPLLLIAMDNYRDKGNDGGPAWDRIISCCYTDIADHPWSSRCSGMKGGHGEWAVATAKGSDMPGVKMELAEKEPEEEGDNDSDDKRAEDEQERATSMPLPPCSACLLKGITCVASGSGACKECRAKKKRCDRVKEKRGRSGSPPTSIPPAKRTRSRSRGRASRPCPPSSAAKSNSPTPSPCSSSLTKPQQQQTVELSGDLHKGAKRPKRAVSSVHAAATASPSTSSSHLPSLNLRRRRAPSPNRGPVAPSRAITTPSQTGLKPGPAYSLQNAPLVTRGEFEHFIGEHRALIARVEELEQEKQHRAMMENIERMNFMLRVMEAIKGPHVGGSSEGAVPQIDVSLPGSTAI